jgi:EAL and modified HD-GYP domain-containing signal transduction protein
MDIDRQFCLPKEDVVLLVDESMTPTDACLERIQFLKAHGYRFAGEKINNYNGMHPIVELCDFLFISCKTPKFKDMFRILKQRYNHLTFVASEVDFMTVFEEIQNEKFDLFEGRFYSVPITRGVSQISPVKVNYINLINMVRSEDFDLDKAAKIIGQDTALTLSLLKLINSPYMKLSREIKTIKHAVAMMGQKEVRKWVTTAVAAMLCSDKPDEITKLSLIRAKFAENLATDFEMAMQSQSLFLMGLFSVLDVILGRPMSDALKVIHVSDDIRQALVERTGDFAKVMDLIYTYEAAHWTEVSRLMILNNLKARDVYEAYIDATLWYSSVVFSTVTIDGEEEQV